ncbi:hypothetical protein H5410_030773 [Solanum commersonii]|uniref:DUF7081 domain-containing protein n=1 Tax=Solanum commersonii TaxID=4109 RepID=A0A9J5YF88_SOLCO|nr:hypothetical protein H5410_030773 [Solanum commersonii]
MCGHPTRKGVPQKKLPICGRVKVSEYDSGEGLPYAPVYCTNVGDKWGWRKLSSLPNGEVNNNKRVGLARVGGVGIPSLPVRDPLPLARGP